MKDLIERQPYHAQQHANTDQQSADDKVCRRGREIHRAANGQQRGADHAQGDALVLGYRRVGVGWGHEI